MEAKVLRGYLRITAFYSLECEWCAETEVEDYSDFKQLPSAIEVQGIRLGKAGWNSDVGLAYYKQGVLLGTKLDKYA
jgi:hypothetical protein